LLLNVNMSRKQAADISRNMLRSIVRRRPLMGFHPCSLLVEDGHDHVQAPAPTGPNTQAHKYLLEQNAAIVKTDGMRKSMLGKCFPVGPRHVCMTRHQLVLPPDTREVLYLAACFNSPPAQRLKLPSSGELPTWKALAEMHSATDFFIVEADAPTNARVFDSWLTPAAPDLSRRLFCPVQVPPKGVS
jgi:hypothetical protein